MPAATAILPRWDMSVVFPGLDAPEYEQAFDGIVADIGALGELFEREGIGAREPAELDDATVRRVETVIGQVNAISERVQTLGVYINAFVTTDSRDNLAQARRSVFPAEMTRLTQLGTRLTAWIGTLDVDGLIERVEVAAEHAFMLRRRRMRPGT